jgi:hydroxyethylthiazole kinase-like sugar kinase family protein
MAQTIGAQSNREHIMKTIIAAGLIAGSVAAALLATPIRRWPRRQVRVQLRTPSMP